MKRYALLTAFVLLLAPLVLMPLVHAQPRQVVASSPASGAANVVLQTTVTFTFDQPVGEGLIDEEVVSVFPQDAVEILDAGLSADGRTVAFQVAHRADTDYTWFVAGSYDDFDLAETVPVRPFVLQYTTGATLGAHSIAGMVSYEGDVEGTIVALAHVNLFGEGLDSDESLVAAGTVDASGSYTVRYLRDGTYWPLAIKFSDTLDSFVPFGAIGFYDADGDGEADSVRVEGGSVAGIDITLFGFDAFGRTAVASLDEARAAAQEVAGDNVLVGIEGSLLLPDGSSLGWSYHFYSATDQTLTHVESGLFGGGVEVEPYERREAPEAVPEPFVDSDVAMQVALDHGGADLLAEHPGALVGMSAGRAAGFFGPDGQEVDAPAWTVFFLAFGATPVQLVVYVDLVTGAYLGSAASREPVTALGLLPEARDVVAAFRPDARLVRFDAFGIQPDGTAPEWSYLFVSDAADSLYQVTFPAMGPPFFDRMGASAGVQAPPLPDVLVDTDAALAAAIEAGGGAFIDAFPDPFVILSGGYLGEAYPDFSTQPIYAVQFTGGNENVFAEMLVIIDMETGVVLHSERHDFPTAKEHGAEVPEAVALGQNYPNPFNPTTTVPVRLEAGGAARLVVYDAAGREVAVLLDDYLPAGTHEVRWNAGGLPSGVYLARLTAAGATRTRSLVLMK